VQPLAVAVREAKANQPVLLKKLPLIMGMYMPMGQQLLQRMAQQEQQLEVEQFEIVLGLL
jgi:hypothetical protein